MNEEFITKLEEVLRNIPIFFNEKGESLDIPIEYFTDADTMRSALVKCLEKDKNNYDYSNEDIESFNIKKDKYGNFYMQVNTKNNTNPLIIPFTNNRIMLEKKAIVVPMGLFMEKLLEKLHSNGIEKIQDITNRVGVGFGYENYSKYVNDYWTDLLSVVKAGNEKMDVEKFLLVKFERLIKYIEYINELTSQGTSISCDLATSESGTKSRIPKSNNEGKYERKCPIIPPDKRFAFLEGEKVEFDGKTYSLGMKPCKKYPINFDKSVRNQFIAYVYNVDNWKEKKGCLIIIEPVSGERSTRFEFVSKEEIDKLERSGRNINDLYRNIIENNLKKTQHELENSKKNHTSFKTFVSNISYILKRDFDELAKSDCSNPSAIKQRLEALIKEIILGSEEERYN